GGGGGLGGGGQGGWGRGVGAGEEVEGQVKWYDPKKGFGFVAVDGSKDVFIHRSVLAREGINELAEGQRIHMKVVPGAKGLEAIGLPIEILTAGTSREIEAAFATMVRDRIEALFVAGDGYFVSRRVQLATLATRHGISASLPSRENVEAGGLMSYGTDLAEVYRQVGDYTGQILKGTKPADLPVAQSTKFEFVINMQTARALGIEVPPGVLALADEV